MATTRVQAEWEYPTDSESADAPYSPDVWTLRRHLTEATTALTEAEAYAKRLERYLGDTIGLYLEALDRGEPDEIARASAVAKVLEGAAVTDVAAPPWEGQDT